MRTLLLIVALCSLSVFGAARAPQDSLSNIQLQQLAHRCFVDGEYEKAAAYNIRIIEGFPDSRYQPYAVMMLGTIYGDRLFEIDKAIHWYTLFLENYAKRRQVQVFERKIRFLQSLGNQKEAYIRFKKVGIGKMTATEKITELENILKEYPDFILRNDLLKKLSSLYLYEKEYRKHYDAAQRWVEDKPALKEKARAQILSHARTIWLRSVLSEIAWGWIVIILFVSVLIKPWQYSTTASLRRYWRMVLVWIALMAAGYFIFHFFVKGANKNPFNGMDTFILFAVNLVILLWIPFFSQSRFWENRRNWLKYLLPVFTCLNVAAAYYLVLFLQPNWIELMDDFYMQYLDFIGVIKELFI